MAWAPPSETDIANMAIDVLDDVPIASLSEDTPVGRFMGRNFWRVYDEVIYAYPWAFARKYQAITRDGTAPAFGFLYRYQIPTDCVRILPPRANGQWGALPILHERVGNYIYCDFEGPLKLIYTSRETNTGLWNPLFNRILAMQLAVYAAQNITGKIGYVEKAKMLLEDAWAKIATESQEAGTPEPQNRSEVVDVRGVGLPAARSFVRYPSE
jgi:hypothetical protein